MNYIQLCIGDYIYLCVHIPSMDSKKALKNGIIALVLLATITLTMTTTTATNVKASTNNNGCSEKELIEEILCGVGDAARGAGSGYKD